MSFMTWYFTVLTILLCPGQVTCRWCTKIISEQHVFTRTELSTCLQSYQHYCGWLSSKLCTFYEQVSCKKESNETVFMNKLVEDCCPGYQLDPTTNVTCIEKPVSKNTPSYSEAKVEIILYDNFTPILTLPQTIKNGNFANNTDSKTKETDVSSSATKKHTSVKNKNPSVKYNKADDPLLFGLSHGEMAGITCAFLFIFCVLILVIVHIIKRKRRNDMVKQNTGTDHELAEKWVTKI